ncbi:MAG: hypothetical protein P8Z42_12410 [Anaerolineales bacterium]
MAKRESTSKVVGVRFNELGKLYHFDASNVPDVKPGDYVIVSTSRGRELGQVVNRPEKPEDCRTGPPHRVEDRNAGCYSS